MAYKESCSKFRKLPTEFIMLHTTSRVVLGVGAGILLAKLLNLGAGMGLDSSSTGSPAGNSANYRILRAQERTKYAKRLKTRHFLGVNA